MNLQSAARKEQQNPIKTGMDSPNTEISRGSWSPVVVCKFIAERIITYQCGNENPEISVTQQDFKLQTENLALQIGFFYYSPV